MFGESTRYAASVAPDDRRYELVVAGPAAKALASDLPESVASAVLEGIWSARRGTYRVLYRIDEDHHEIVVLRIDHRRGAYRPH